ncbi:MAG: NUDIX domain-containing protein [Bacilli bacterium]|nr:NUDIX domain-containing protein [Bacilli bacterium]
MRVVGTLFIENEKLLLNLSRKSTIYQLVAGKIENGETPIEAMIREAHEELGDKAIIDVNAFEQILEFDEIASSDNITPIHYYLFKYNGVIEGKITTSDEITSYLWYDTSINDIMLSNTLNHVVIPYCKEKKLIR